ncbi:uncharacterized protein B0H64DRAFT_460868 [Chaetomium fimeti]|uniref:intramembrane prenyl-peptidase Rce1 n=1 Tax=Chaetomium fimeti TaxID=1854472 RepID=A0AAE0HGG3_9PEZI|nr:hypothetical protein B0H64DRAFT_460868 [Chaetomium fimeti]
MPALTDTLRKLNPWHEGKYLRRKLSHATPSSPPITTRAAYGLIALYALSYFVPFYLSRTTRPSPTLTRDAPSVIRARIRSVTLSCLACTGVTYVVLSRAGNTGGTTPPEALHLLGLWPVGLWDSLRALFLTALLFAGPLFSYLVVDRGWADWVRLEPVRDVWAEWTTWRNIIAGPITEEMLFRSASIPLMHLAASPPTTTIFLTPVIFGLAHVHHLYEFRLTHPGVPAAAALLRSAFQFAYTTLFGAYATFLYLRSGSLLAVCAVHAFCNCMGLPQIWGRVEPVAAAAVPVVPVMVGGDVGEGERDALLRGGNRGRPSILWTVAYYVLLVGGAVMWYRNLWVLSESGNGLVPGSAFSGGSA